MPYEIHESTGRTRIRRFRTAGVLFVIVATAAVLGDQLPVYGSSPVTNPFAASGSKRTEPRGEPRDGRGAALGESGGALPGDTTVFDDDFPGLTRLDPALLKALRGAAKDASVAAGIEFVVDSGWRSKAYQARLLREAVSKYGSEQEAARWVATPATSPHVTGDAADIGPASATQWLSLHGSAYGLCQIYSNEPWHYELRESTHGCPAMYADPTQDPRMQG